MASSPPMSWKSRFFMYLANYPTTRAKTRPRILVTRHTFLRCLTTTLEGRTSIGHHFLYCGHVQTDHMAVRQSQAAMQIIQQERIRQAPRQHYRACQSDETKLSRKQPTDAYKD